ncbi:MAG: serine/threonine-protein kinase [Planctomycetota bacterium]
MADPKKQPAQSRWLNKRIGKFRLLSLLGRGAMGKVFLAEDTKLHRQVALKVVSVKKDDRQADAKAQQFIREARAAAKLNHPHIVNVLEIDEQKDLLYIAMDLVQGGDVKQLIKHSGRLSPAKACDLAADAADALAFGHRLGIIHRDIKPSNLMLTREGRCKVADFGLADLGDPNDDFRLPDGIIGTPATMAPEVARGLPALPASDQYSLGCTVWHMLTGEPIFTGKNFRDVLHQQVNATPHALAELCPDLPASLIEAIETALHKDPAHRHADCEVFARLLRVHSMALGPASASASMSHASMAMLGGPPSVALPAKRKTPWLIAGASAGALALGIGGAALVMGSGNANPTPTPPPLTSSTSNIALAPAESDAAPTPPAAPATNPPAAPTSTAEPPAFTANQTDDIKPLVAADTLVAVTGTVATAELSATGKTFMVKFTGNDTGDFQVIWKPKVYDTMAQAFGGEHGEGLAGQTIRVTGELSSMFGTPQINAKTPDQIQIVE